MNESGTPVTGQMVDDGADTAPRLNGLGASACSPFALLILTSLAVKRFNSRDEQRIAMDALQTKGVRFVALKYHHGAQTYIVPEVHE